METIIINSVISQQLHKLYNKLYNDIINNINKYDAICYFDGSYRDDLRYGCCGMILIDNINNILNYKSRVLKLPNVGSSYYEESAYNQLLSMIINYNQNYSYLIYGDCKTTINKAKMDIYKHNLNVKLKEIHSKRNMADYMSTRYYDIDGYIGLNINR